MKAVILAAGEGNRMRPLTYTRPKVMLPLVNKPILEHLLIEAREAGIMEFVFVVGYHDEQVRGYFGDGKQWDVSIQYCSQRRQQGTADAIRMVEGMFNENFLVTNGDILLNRQDFRSLANQRGTTLSIFRVEDPRGLGVVEVQSGKVVRIYEKVDKPPFNTANAALYLFTPEIFAAIANTPRSPRGEYEITDSIQLLIDGGQPVSAYEISDWLDLTYPWDLFSANERLLKSIRSLNEGKIENNVVLQNAVVIGKGTVVRSGAYIVGPVVIGQNCDIGPNCFIRPSTSIGDNCHIGAAVEVKNSIIMKGSKVPHLNYVGDSIIGEDCNLGAGTKTANVRLDRKNISAGGSDTRRRKLGAIIGDKVETGINVSINVGTVIGNNVHIGPGALVSGVVSPETKIF